MAEQLMLAKWAHASLPRKIIADVLSGVCAMRRKTAALASLDVELMASCAGWGLVYFLIRCDWVRCDVFLQRTVVVECSLCELDKQSLLFVFCMSRWFSKLGKQTRIFWRSYTEPILFDLMWIIGVAVEQSCCESSLFLWVQSLSCITWFHAEHIVTRMFTANSSSLTDKALPYLSSSAVINTRIDETGAFYQHVVFANCFSDRLQTEADNNWKICHPSKWSNADVLDLIYFVAEKSKFIDVTHLSGERFQDIDGIKLPSMTKRDFVKRDPTYGHMLYDTIKELLSQS